MEFQRARKCECCENEIAKINALKFSNPSRVFAVDVKARSMEMTERESRGWTFECRALKMEIFRRLEGANFAKG